MIEQKLLDLGFKEFHNQFKPNHKSYQLKVYSDDGHTKLYFVNVDLFDYNSWEYSNRVPESLKEDLQPEWDVQFNTHSNQETFNVQWLGKDPEEALKFFHKIFVNMSCDSYD